MTKQTDWLFRFCNAIKKEEIKMISNDRLLNIPVTPFTSFQNCIECILKLLSNSDKNKYSIFTPNVHHFYLYNSDSEMKKAYDSCTLSLIDGMPLVWTYRLLKKRKVVKVSGSDVFSYLLPILVKKNKKIFLLGGEEGVAKNAVNNLCSDINHRIFTYSPPFGFEKKSNQNYIILDKINKIKPDILFVAFGAPKQEKWIYANLKKINAKIAIGVGGSFDFAAGIQKRAPVWMQKLSLEWFYRLLCNPKRLFKRYLITNSFFILILMFEVLKMTISKICRHKIFRR